MPGRPRCIKATRCRARAGVGVRVTTHLEPAVGVACPEHPLEQPGRTRPGREIPPVWSPKTVSYMVLGEFDVIDIDGDEFDITNDGAVLSQRIDAPLGRHHDAAEFLVVGAVVGRRSRIEDLGRVVMPTQQPGLVVVEDLFRRVSGNTAGKVTWSRRKVAPSSVTGSSSSVLKSGEAKVKGR